MKKQLYELSEINSKLLVVDRDLYQRKKHKDKIAQIVASWDERIANEPKVSLRDGIYHVFDGQHTILAREAMNDNNPIKILCKVYYGLSEKDEALLFAKQTGISSKPSSGERLRANLYGEDEEALDLCKATEKAGLSIDVKGTRHKNHIACVSTALHAYRVLGNVLYIEALSIVAGAWKGKKDSLRFEIIKAVTEFVQYYNGQYDKAVLITALESKKPISIRNKIITDYEHPKNIRYARQIMLAYNSKSNKPLPELGTSDRKSRLTHFIN